MLKLLEEIFEKGTIEINSNGERIELHSHTPKEQGVFLQNLYEKVNPVRSLEVGLALGISTLFILEKAREKLKTDKTHIVIEPLPWGNAAIHNIQKEGLSGYVDIRNALSDVVIPAMYLNDERIQFAYVDTTKIFDTIMQDFYFIDKILDVGGVIVFDDASTGGISMVMRFINSLPHYKIVERFQQIEVSKTYSIGAKLFEGLLSFLPFKSRYMPNYSFKTTHQLGLDYRCIAFKKIAADTRRWDWVKPF